MRIVTITVLLLLITTGALRAEDLRDMLNMADSLASLKQRGPVSSFHATIRIIDVDKITFVKHEPNGDEKDEQLVAAADCKLFESRRNKETGSVEMYPVDGGLKGHIDPLEFNTANIFVNRENKIVEIRGDGDARTGIANRFHALVKKIEGDKIVVKFGKFGKGSENTFTLAHDCKVLELRFGREGLPLVTEPVAEGLKSPAFTKEPVQALFTTDKDRNVSEVCIPPPSPHVFDATIKKIEGDKLILVKHLVDGSKGNELPFSATAGCAVFETKFDKARSSKFLYEDGLKCDFLTLKRSELRVHTDKEQKITSINVLHNPYWFEAVAMMSDVDRIRIPNDRKNTYLALAPECKILQGRVDRETAKTTYVPVKEGIKGAAIPKRPFAAFVKLNDDDKVTEMRFHKDPANFPARIFKVEGKDGETIISVIEPGLTGPPGSKIKVTYHTDLTAAKDYRAFRRKTVDGKSVLEPIEKNLAWWHVNAKISGGKVTFPPVIVRVLLGNDGKVTEVQILDGVTSVEQVK